MPDVVIDPASGLPCAVCAALMHPDQRLLAVSRRHKNTLGMAGGKHDVGETAQEALVREVLEETGVRIDPATLVLLYAGVCPPEDPNGQAYWCTTYTAPLPLDQVPQSREPGIVPLLVSWDELLQRGAFQDYDARVHAAFLAHNRAPRTTG